MSVDYLLHESSVGYAVFQVLHQVDAIANRSREVQDSMNDLTKFGKMVKVVAFSAFPGAAQALENVNDISEGICSEYLQSLLEISLPKAGKKNKVALGVSDKNLGGSIKAVFPGLECQTSDTSEIVADMLRALRQHAPKLLKELNDGDIERGQLGLAHAYSRARVKFSVQKNDNHIIQAIATLDNLDKAVNTFSMRVREWYSWHFPELIKIVSDNHTYAKLTLFIRNKTRLTDEHLHDLAAQVDDDAEIAQSIIDAAKVSMGRDISENDMDTVMSFAERVVGLTQYRKNLQAYLASKMSIVAPNLAALIGDVVGARLISHAGSLASLCKYPASTVQILGAEKALFRALKTKGNTPKYGLLYHSTFIGRAGQKNKGRISRFLANKCSIASRIDNFSEVPSSKFGEALRQQVEERLEFYNSGKPPMKNADAMNAVMDSVLTDIGVEDPTAEVDTEMVDVAPRAVQKQEKKKKDRKESKEEKKKRKATEADVDGETGGEKEKKKKKKKKSDVEIE